MIVIGSVLYSSRPCITSLLHTVFSKHCDRQGRSVALRHYMWIGGCNQLTPRDAIASVFCHSQVALSPFPDPLPSLLVSLALSQSYIAHHTLYKPTRFKMVSMLALALALIVPCALGASPSFAASSRLIVSCSQDHYHRSWSTGPSLDPVYCALYPIPCLGMHLTFSQEVRRYLRR